MVLSEGESRSQCLRFRCLFVLWSQRQAERTRQRLKPCGRERQILRRPPPPPPAGHAGLALASRLRAQPGWKAGWRFFPQQRAAGRGPWGRRRKRRLAISGAILPSRGKGFLPIPRALHPPSLARGDGGVKEVWSKGQYPWEVKSSARRCLGAGSGVRPRGRCRDRPRDLVAAMSHVRAGLEEAGGSGGAPARGRGHLSWRSPSRPS